MLAPLLLSLLLAATALVSLTGCQGAVDAVQSVAGGQTLEGDPMPSGKMQTVSFDAARCTSANGASVDVSHAAQGYVAAKGTSKKTLRLMLKCGSQSYNYLMPSNGKVVFAPINMGDGIYTVSVMENTTENKYVVLVSAEVDVKLDSETAPFTRASVYCNYSAKSACVAKAAELAAQSDNQAEFLAKVYDYVVGNISYDNDKAAKLASASDYIPNPDKTLASGKGICFDYASLCAAMLRSQGIPCKIVTGNVEPNNVYHAWNMVYISGTWVTATVDVQKNEWSLIDTTFAATGGGSTVGDGSSYTERFTY